MEKDVLLLKIEQLEKENQEAHELIDYIKDNFISRNELNKELYQMNEHANAIRESCLRRILEKISYIENNNTDIKKELIDGRKESINKLTLIIISSINFILTAGLTVTLFLMK
ncbi:MAG: hypothetical protein AABY07_10990 [Nanoarchaeota archaeon]